MVLVERLGTRLAQGDEIVIAVQALEYRGGALFAGEAARHAGAHLRQAGGAQQKLLRRGIALLENFARQVIEHELARGEIGRFPQRSQLRLLEHQHKPGCPALRRGIDALERFRVEARPALERDLFGLLARETQVLPGEHDEHAVRAQPREAGWRIAAAHDERAAALGQLAERNAHHFVQLGGRRDLVIAVEHHRERRLEQRVERLEIAPREHGQRGVVFGPEQRQRFRRSRRELLGSEAQIVEERRRIGIALVELVP